MFRRLSRLFGRPPASDRQEMAVGVQCARCGEVIQTRIDLQNDLSVDYGDSPEKDSFICRKTLMGSGRCFNRVEIVLTFDARRRLVDRQVAGGEFVDAEPG